MTPLLQDDWLTPEQLAARIGQTPANLAKWRSTGKGPRFLKFGRQIRYPSAGVEEWLLSKLQHGTQEPRRHLVHSLPVPRPDDQKKHRFGRNRTKQERSEQARTAAARRSQVAGQNANGWPGSTRGGLVQ